MEADNTVYAHYYESLEIGVDVDVVYHDPAESGWSNEDSDGIKLSIVRRPRYVTDGLVLSYDARNNLQLGKALNTAEWKDLVGDNDGTLVNGLQWTKGAEWANSYLLFDGVSDNKVSFAGDVIPLYTFVATFECDKTATSSYPRITAENPYPSIYIKGSTLGIYLPGGFDQNFAGAPIPGLL